MSHSLELTMLDGKAINALSDTKSSMSCNICGSTPKDMNKLSTQNRKCKEENYAYGLSTLHCWIRSLECLLHISYKLEVKKWSATSEKEKALVLSKKLKIQEEFQREKGMIHNIFFYNITVSRK